MRYCELTPPKILEFPLYRRRVLSLPKKPSQIKSFFRTRHAKSPDFPHRTENPTAEKRQNRTPKFLRCANNQSRRASDARSSPPQTTSGAWPLERAYMPPNRFTVLILPRAELRQSKARLLWLFAQERGVGKRRFSAVRFSAGHSRPGECYSHSKASCRRRA